MSSFIAKNHHTNVGIVAKFALIATGIEIPLRTVRPSVTHRHKYKFLVAITNASAVRAARMGAFEKVRGIEVDLPDKLQRRGPRNSGRTVR